MQNACPASCERARLVEEEAIIDVGEWAEIHGHPAPFPVPAGITARLWHRIERIPFRLAGRVTIEDRVLDLVSRVQSHLRRYSACGAIATSAERSLLRFAAALPSTDRDGDTHALVIHGAPCRSCPLVLTIGMASEAWAQDDGLRPSCVPVPSIDQPVFP